MGRLARRSSAPTRSPSPARCPTAPPIVVDLSLSKVARGNILAAKQRGERIPEGWALDATGEPTTDPEAALAGTMLPLGDAKGTALALMVELLAAGLTGANYAAEASSFLDDEGGPPGTGQLILALDPQAFGGRTRSPASARSRRRSRSSPARAFPAGAGSSCAEKAQAEGLAGRGRAAEGDRGALSGSHPASAKSRAGDAHGAARRSASARFAPAGDGE